MQISAKWKVSENRESRTDRAPLKVQLRGKQCVVMSHITIWILSFGPEYCFVSWGLCFAVCCSEKGMNWWHVSIVILYVIFLLIFEEKCNIFAPLFSQHNLFHVQMETYPIVLFSRDTKENKKKITLWINLLCTFLLLLYFVIKTKYLQKDRTERA